MFGTPKPTASLSSSLLARKGQARRRCARRVSSASTRRLPRKISAGTTWASHAHAHVHAQQFAAEPVPAPQPKPQVLRQIEQLDERFSAPEPAAAPAPVAAPQPGSGRAASCPAAGRRGTAGPAKWRRNPRRRSRSASTTTGICACASHRRSPIVRREQLVTEALDAFLESLTEVEDARASSVGPAGNR